MDSHSSVWSLRDTGLSRKHRALEFSLCVIAAFSVPFFIGQPQLIVGTIVNAALILSALHFKNYKVMPVILLPSLAVLMRGLIFGPFTYFLIYTIPFIWMGNSALVYVIKRLYLGAGWNKNLALAISICAKVLILYLSATLLIRFGVLPKVFAISMGVLQLYTAVAGSLVVLLLEFFQNKKR